MTYDAAAFVRCVVDMIRKQPGRPLSEIAEELQVHRHTILRAIARENLDITDLRRHYLDTRFEELSQSEPFACIKTIAYSLGYASPSSFCRAVKRVRGVCPSELRRRTAL